MVFYVLSKYLLSAYGVSDTLLRAGDKIPVILNSGLLHQKYINASITC